jgi:hypothetical protein
VPVTENKEFGKNFLGIKSHCQIRPDQLKGETEYMFVSVVAGLATEGIGGSRTPQQED